MTPPTLSTERLLLVPFGATHLNDRYVSWLNDPDVVQFSEQRHRSHDLSSCEAFVRSFDHGPNHLWAIEEQKSGRHIGNITTACDVPNKIADIQILLGERDIWGYGYGAEAWQAVMDYLFNSGFRKVTAGTMAVNHGMLKIMSKCGMQVEGRRADHFIFEGRSVDLIFSAAFAANDQTKT